MCDVGVTVECDVGLFVGSIGGKRTDTAADTEAVAVTEIQRITAECQAFVLCDAEIGVGLAVAVACDRIKRNGRKRGTECEHFCRTVTEVQYGFGGIGMRGNDGADRLQSAVRIGEYQKFHGRHVLSCFENIGWDRNIADG